MTVGNLCADANGRRVGRSQFRVRFLDGRELAEQPVILGVAKRRLIEYVVLVRRPSEQRAQLFCARRRGRCGAQSAASPPSCEARPPCRRKLSTKNIPDSPARLTMRSKVSIDDISSRCSITNHSSMFLLE